jgi:imidazolonepropionase-like amidohydrolase
MRALVSLLCLITMTAHAAGEDAPAAPVALVGVNVIPMDRERVLTNHTLVIREGRIAALGPAADVKPPRGATVVDARGKFVIPGLAEMHGHLAGDDTAYNERILLLNVLHGVTTVRVMQGHPSHLVLRERVRRGNLIGPLLYIAAPQLNASSAPTPEAATAAVRQAKQQGFDLLKIQEGLSLASFDAMARTASELHLPFAGHVPAAVGLRRALQAKYSTVDHMDGYFEALVPAAQGSAEPAEAGWFGSAIIDRIDATKIPALIQATKAAGTGIVPTETLLVNFLTAEPPEALFAQPELALLPKSVVAGWQRQKQQLNSQLAAMPASQREKYLAARRQLLEGLHAAGVPILLGSDAPQVLNVPGSAIADELELMVKAGLTPYQAIEAGTANVARHFGTQQDGGTIATGKRADLLVLEANPLTDVGSVRQRFGVFVDGRWLSREQIDEQLRALTTS